MIRSKVEDISITIRTNGGLGRKVTLHIDPNNCSAIFFDDFAVENLLKKFYKESPGKKLGRDNSMKRFGQKITEKLFGTNLEIDITEDVVNTLWTETTILEEQTPYLVKRPPCDLE